jgi:hypothetical protein
MGCGCEISSDSGCGMKVTALLRDPAGVERECEIGWPLVCVNMDEERHLAYAMFGDGNYACDCNRSLWLHELDFDEAWPCGSTIRCLSLKIDGEEIYSERDEPAVESPSL